MQDASVRHMRPATTISQLSDGAAMNAKFPGYCRGPFTISQPSANAGDNSRRQHLILSALCNHIRNIVRLCSKKQVGRIDAATIVAGVAHNGLGRNFPNIDFIRGSVGQFDLVGFIGTAISDAAVTISDLGRQPFPAFIGLCFCDVVPESFVERFHHVRMLNGFPKISQGGF